MLPYSFSSRILLTEIQTLIKACWEEHVIEEIIMGREDDDAGMEVPFLGGLPKDILSMERHLMERRLQRANLESRLYSKALAGEH